MFLRNIFRSINEIPMFYKNFIKIIIDNIFPKYIPPLFNNQWITYNIKMQPIYILIKAYQYNNFLINIYYLIKITDTI